jgi:hypothetical protein
MSLPGFGYQTLRNLGIAVAAIGLLAMAVAVETHVFNPNFDAPGVNAVRLASDGTAVEGATLNVVRKNDVTTLAFTTSGLPANHIVVLEAQIFNEPTKCTHGSGSVRCGVDDLSDPEVKGSVVFVSGVWLRTSTMATLKGELKTDDASRAVLGEGLTNPHGADLRLVLVDHGAPVSEFAQAQLTTLAGGCTNAPPGYGTPGPIACKELQVGIDQK